MFYALYQLLSKQNRLASNKKVTKCLQQVTNNVGSRRFVGAKVVIIWQTAKPRYKKLGSLSSRTANP